MGFSDLFESAKDAVKTAGRGSLWKAAFKQAKAKVADSVGMRDKTYGEKYYGLTEQNMNDPDLNARMEADRRSDHQAAIDSLPMLQRVAIQAQRERNKTEIADREERWRRNRQGQVIPELQGLPESRIKRQTGR